MSKVLLAVTTYNQLDYTKKFYESFRKLENDDIDLIIFDDASDDGTPLWCFDHDIQCHVKDEPKGLTHSWNMAYNIFRTRDIGLAGYKSYMYDYLIIANNDILIPKGAIEELVEVAEKWPFSVVVPLSSKIGAGHNADSQAVSSHYSDISDDFLHNPDNYQQIQNSLTAHKLRLESTNNKFLVDPIRQKLFNGFFFLMTRDVINYEIDGELFDETKPLYKAEDEFNWAKLIPNNDFSALCKTSFVYHFKGKSTENFSMEHNTIETFNNKRKVIDKNI